MPRKEKGDQNKYWIYVVLQTVRGIDRTTASEESTDGDSSRRFRRPAQSMCQVLDGSHVTVQSS